MKIFRRLAVVIIIGAIAGAATWSFFHDEETSSGNTFVAGDIDLQIDNESYVTNTEGQLIYSDPTSWELEDLVPGTHHFFDFINLEPGDLGEDTISIHVESNDAWLCAAARITDNSDQTCNDSETDDDPICSEPGLGTGDLAEALNFVFWHDDGDNVLEDNEDESIFLQGPLSGIDEQGVISLADTQTNVFGTDGPIAGDETVYIGKAWCFGELAVAPIEQDEEGALPERTNGPLVRTTGVTCNGSALDNAAQTDQVQGDMQFYAVQARNNTDFTCQDDYTPAWPENGQRPIVGANLATYQQPEGGDCDVWVPDDFVTIQEAIDDDGTADGDTICVGSGEYNENVVINKSITLAGDGATATSVIAGEIAENELSPGFATVLIEADNVTLQGFQINGNNYMELLLNDGISGAKILSNKITTIQDGMAAGLLGVQQEHLFQSNEFVGTDAGIVVSISDESRDIDLMNNTFLGSLAEEINLGVIYNEATGSKVKGNIFSASLTGPFFGIISSTKDDLMVNQNNFYGTGEVKVANLAEAGGNMDATHNWWGATEPVGHTVGNVDDSLKEADPFQEY